MKTFLSVLILSMSFLSGSFSQIKPPRKSTTRAVLIGISDYKYDKVVDLKYADADVKAFRDYLRRQKDLPDQQIRLLTNEQATKAAIIEALQWLLDESRKGDQAIIYFSGHGDKEVDVEELSFLLAYDTPQVAYGPGAIDLRVLEDFIRKLSEDKQSEVIVIADACRSGNLIGGGAINGSQLTNAALTARAFNEVRLLSCQSDEYSKEGTEWGDGRGAFSFHLVNGLVGLADGNANEKIELREIRAYLQEVVPQETKGEQIPEVLGHPEKELADIDPDLLAELQSNQQQQTDLLAAASYSRGSEEAKDTSVSELYRLFRQALADRHLLYPEEGSAYQLYRRLSEDESIRMLEPSMRRSLAGAFQEEAQEPINDYIIGNPDELAKRWAYGTRYSHHPEYLAKAAELFGENSVHGQDLKGNYHYFVGLNKRLEAEEKYNTALYEEALIDQQKALELNPQGPHILNEIGVLLLHMKKYEAAKNYLHRAHFLSPNWSLPLNNLSFAHYRMESYDSAAIYGQRTLAIDPELVFVRINLGLLAEAKGDSIRAENYYREIIERNPEYGQGYLLLGWLLSEQGRLEEAEEMMNICLILEPENINAIYRLGIIKWDQGALAEAEKRFREIIDLNPEWPWSYLSLAQIQVDFRAQYEQAEAYLRRYLELEPEDEEAMIYLMLTHTLQGELDEAASLLRTAAGIGISEDNWKRLQTDERLEPLRNTAAFKELLRTYKPE